MARYNQRDNNGSLLPKAGIFAAIMAVLYFGYQFLNSGKATALPNSEPTTQSSHPAGTPDGNISPGPGDIPGTPARPTYLPTGDEGTIVQHQYYTLSYNEDHEQANWVAYELTREQLNSNRVERSDEFRSDPAISSGSATTWDYKGSGYDRGHLVPAGDRGFSETAMQETFYMSNMSPQIGPFNKGIWRELEEQTRDWARKFKRLYIVTGPVLSKRPSGAIGDNEVSVPVSYYKVLLDADDPEKKGIAFIIPNDISDIPLRDFAISIDDAERITGLDFFSQFLPAEIEKIERKMDKSLWEMNEQRYQLRVTKWNFQK
jgi:endonuclease G